MAESATVLCLQCRETNAEGRSTCKRCGTPLPVTSGPTGAVHPARSSEGFRRGQIFASRYVVQDVIGRGGMGCIYKAHDNTLKEIVALKTLLPELVRDQLIVERFFNEARIARSLSHPNIVRVHDISAAENVVFISMEFLKGKSLRDILESLTPGQRVGIKTILRIFDELCAALEYAHRFTVHRDIKPENVMIASDGHVKLMDFGISKLMDHTNLTQASMVMGTPQYMSPEQLRNTSKVDGRADIYSVGVMLYEVITGNIPTGVPKPVSEISQSVPPALDPIIAKCVDPDPSKRYQTASELRGALDEVRKLVEAGSDLIQRTARPPAKPERAWARPALLAGSIAVILALAGFGLYGAERERQEKLAHAATAASQPREIALAPSEASAAVLQWQRLVETAARRAKAVAAEPANANESERMLELIAVGEDLAEITADEKRENPERAIQKLREGLPYFLAVAARPAGMTFIPAGSVDAPTPSGSVTSVELGAFFIDTAPVTVGQFARFSREAPWRAMPAGGAQDAPISAVTFYDAQAFAANHEPQRALPTVAQWLRAARYKQESGAIVPWGQPLEEEDAPAEPFRVIDGLLEWTRTTQSGGVPDFRSYLFVAGGDCSGEDGCTFAWNAAQFESQRSSIGFRCVFELPDDLASLERLFAQ